MNSEYIVMDLFTVFSILDIFFDGETIDTVVKSSSKYLKSHNLRAISSILVKYYSSVKCLNWTYASDNSSVVLTS